MKKFITLMIVMFFVLGIFNLSSAVEDENVSRASIKDKAEAAGEEAGKDNAVVEQKEPAPAEKKKSQKKVFKSKLVHLLSLDFILIQLIQLKVERHNFP